MKSGEEKVFKGPIGIGILFVMSASLGYAVGVQLF